MSHRSGWRSQTELGRQIRSLSTYGSLAITGLNVLLFVTTLLLIEPWKRKHLVEGVESRSLPFSTGTAPDT